MAQLRATRPRRAARPRRRGELLDPDLHQLAPPASLRPGLVAGLPRRRAGGRRGPHPGVLLRARPRAGAARREDRAVEYPVAADNDYEVWNAFDNHYWPALYFIDTEGVVRGQHFGEGSYERSEQILQRLLGISRDLVTVQGSGVEAPADWAHLLTPETYLGHGRSQNFASVNGAHDRGKVYALPACLPLNHWALEGAWTVGRERAVLDQGGGSIAFRFHARDAHLVLASRTRDPIAFQVLLDGEPPGPSHGVDLDADGTGVLHGGRMYQLVREHDTVRERTLQITFTEPGVEAYAFTFG